MRKHDPQFLPRFVPPDKAVREVMWFLDHPRLYRWIGVWWLHWRYPEMWLPRPGGPSQEAIERGRELAKEHGWGSGE